MSFAQLLQALGQGAKLHELPALLEARQAAMGSDLARGLDSSLGDLPRMPSSSPVRAASPPPVPTPTEPLLHAAESAPLTDAAPVADAAAATGPRPLLPPDQLQTLQQRFAQYSSDAYTDMLEKGRTPQQAQAELRSWAEAFNSPRPIPESEYAALAREPGGFMVKLYQQYHPQLHPEAHTPIPEEAAEAVPEAHALEQAESAAPTPTETPPTGPEAATPSLAERDAVLRSTLPPPGGVPTPEQAADLRANWGTLGGATPQAAAPTADLLGFEPQTASTFTKDPEGFFRRTAHSETIPLRAHLLDAATEETLPYWQSRAQEAAQVARRQAQRGDTQAAASSEKSAAFWSGLIEDFVNRSEDTPAELRRAELGQNSALTQDEQVTSRAKQRLRPEQGTAAEVPVPGTTPGAMIQDVGEEIDLANASARTNTTPRLSAPQLSTQLKKLLGSLNRISLRPQDQATLQDIGARLGQASDAELPGLYERALAAARDQRTGELPPMFAAGANAGRFQDLEHGRELPAPQVVDARTQDPAEQLSRTSLEEQPTKVHQARSELNQAAGQRVPTDPRARYQQAANTLSAWDSQGWDALKPQDHLYILDLAVKADRSPRSLNAAEQALVHRYDAEAAD